MTLNAHKVRQLMDANDARRAATSCNRAQKNSLSHKRLSVARLIPLNLEASLQCVIENRSLALRGSCVAAASQRPPVLQSDRIALDRIGRIGSNWVPARRRRPLARIGRSKTNVAANDRASDYTLAHSNDDINHHCFSPPLAASQVEEPATRRPLISARSSGAHSFACICIYLLQQVGRTGRLGFGFGFEFGFGFGLGLGSKFKFRLSAKTIGRSGSYRAPDCWFLLARRQLP